MSGRGRRCALPPSRGEEGKMHTQQMQPQEAGNITGFNEVATRSGAAGVELLNRMLHTCSPPRPRKAAPGGRSGVRSSEEGLSPGS